MNILDKIVADKTREVALKKSLIPTSQLERSVLIDRTSKSLSKLLIESTSGIIAEHKRRSPSKAIINQSLSVDFVVLGYNKTDVCGMSILTDGKYFGGSTDDMLLARAVTEMPLLRKEFIIDTYQILEAKAYGADVILLIAAILDENQIKTLSQFAKSIGLNVLLEIHNLEELQRSLHDSIDMIGVNNRNLKTFDVSLETSKNIASEIPDNFVKVSESGISSAEAIRELRNYGYRGFLIGENFMKTDNPSKHAASFIKQI